MLGGRGVAESGRGDGGVDEVGGGVVEGEVEGWGSGAGAGVGSVVAAVEGWVTGVGVEVGKGEERGVFWRRGVVIFYLGEEREEVFCGEAVALVGAETAGCDVAVPGGDILG